MSRCRKKFAATANAQLFSCCVYAPVIHRPAATDRHQSVNANTANDAKWMRK
jgi:hypothetical protein